MLYIYICALIYTILYDMICVGMATCLSGSFATSCFRQQGGTSRVIITLQALKRPRFYDKERLKTNNGPKTYRGRIYWTCPIWSVSYPPNWSGPKYWSQMRSRYIYICVFTSFCAIQTSQLAAACRVHPDLTMEY